MFRLELLLICVYLTKLSASGKCTDETPWFCKHSVSVDDINEEYTARTLTDTHYKDIKHNESEIDGPIPEEFDARKAWPHCPSISRIINQGACDSCWAVCATSVINDRICIASKGKEQVEVSVNDMVTCCEDCPANRTHRCSDGGSIRRSNEHFVDHGIVSSKCKPYYEINKLKIPNVPCVNKCTANSSLDYNEDKRRGSYVLLGFKNTTFETTVKDVQIEIMKNGPVCALVRYYGKEFSQDYKEGVLICPRDPASNSGHGARIIGWGTEGGVPYWLVANSWGTSWGDNGYFKIRRGTNELAFEEIFYAVGIEPSIKTKKDRIFTKPAGHVKRSTSNSGSHLIQPWKFILQIYILHSLYTIKKYFPFDNVCLKNI